MSNVENSNNNKLTLTITTPRGVKFVETADMVIMRAIDGDLGVLPGHEPTSVVLGDGVLRIINDGKEKLLAVFGGIANIVNQEINLLTTIAQRPDEIDLERAEEDRREAEAIVQEEIDEQVDLELQVRLTRALVRIRVSQTDFFDDDDDDESESDEETY